MEEPLRGRAKPKKLRVRFPDGVEFCYSSAKETFLETLRKIGGRRLSAVKFEVCHLPMFSKTVYELYKDFMEPVGDGWYVNTQGDTYNKYVQLKTINEQLNLGLEIDMSENFKGQRVSRGSKGMAVLEVTLPDHTVIGEENTTDTFMQCIWHLGVDNVRNLNLQHGGKDLITTAKLYRGQVQVDVDRWLVVPAALKDKVKILRVISAMLHIKMDITFFSTSEGKSYKRIRSIKKQEEKKEEEQVKFHRGDIVFHNIYGEGEVREHYKGTNSYKVQFYVKFKAFSDKYQMRDVHEDDLVEYDGQVTPVVKRQNKKEESDKPANAKKENSVIKDSSKQHKNSSKEDVNVLRSRTNDIRSSLIIKKEVEEKEVHRIAKYNEPVKAENKSSDKRYAIITSKFIPGDIVYHKEFGKGIIRQYYKNTNTYKVRFINIRNHSYRVIDEEELSIRPFDDTSLSKEANNKGLRSIDNNKENTKTTIEANKAGRDVTNSQKFRFNVGDKVFCKGYGDGVIIGYDYQKDSTSCIVRFTLGSVGSPRGAKIAIIEEGKLIPLRKNDVISTPTNYNITKYAVGDKVACEKYGYGIIREHTVGNIYKVFFPKSLNPTHNKDFTIYINGEHLRIII